MPDDTRTCPACGARLKEEATVCDLCGTAVAEAAESTAGAEEAAPVPKQPAAPSAAGVFCNACGWKNPPGARFCSQCGSKLQEGAVAAIAPATPSKPRAVPARVPDDVDTNPERLGVVRGSADEKAVSRQVGILVGSGVLLVVVLFLITAVSSRTETPAPVAQATPPPGATAAPGASAPLPSVDTPLPAQVQQRIEELRTQAAAASDQAEEVALRTQMVNLLEGSGRLDLAAHEQEHVAELENTVSAWRHAGNLYYDWMSTEEHSEHKIPIAEKAIEAYEKVLTIDPGNLDARTDMAVAYLSTNNPMQGVEEISAVLAQDSTHIPARFNYGVMLAMIGRMEKARTQFEVVKELVGDPNSPYYQRADEALSSLVQAGP